MIDAQTLHCFYAEMQKEAGRAYLHELRAMARAGNMEGVEAMAKKLHATGALKVSGPGTQLHLLGSGTEGPAHLVIGAKNNPTTPMVRKTFDPKSPQVSKDMLDRKVQAMRMLRGNPDFAQLQGTGLGRGASGGRYIHTEHVPGREATTIESATHPVMSKNAPEALKTRGDRFLGDIHGNPGNTRTTPTGEHKVIDFTPTTGAQVQGATAAARAQLQPRFGHVVKNHFDAGTLGTPTAQKQLAYLGQRQVAAQQQHLGLSTQASDVVPGVGLRKADVPRALRGLGPGSPRERG